jgi:Tfp pilus assembly protein PilF
LNLIPILDPAHRFDAGEGASTYLSKTEQRISFGRDGVGWAVLPLVVAVSLAYSNSFRGPMILDDIPSIVDNASIRQLRPLSATLWPAGPGGNTTDGRPLVHLSVALNYAIGGLDVWGYHAFNLAVHVLATLTLFGLVRRTLLLPRFQSALGSQAVPLAFAVALLWGLHPLQTESVTYIVQRAESMVGLFYLLTLYSVARGEASAHPTGWHIAAVASCLAGMATKEVMATAPVVVFLYLWLVAEVATRPLGTLRRRGCLLAALSATWLPLAALVLAGQGRGGSVGFDEAMGPLGYGGLQLVAVARYLKLCFWPHPLILDYGRQVTARGVQIAAAGILIGLLVAATLWAVRRCTWIGFLGSAFFLILAPSSSVVPVLTQPVAEHRMYLPLGAVIALVVFAFHLAWNKLVPDNTGLWHRSGPALLLTAAALVLGLQTWLRNQDYRTAIAIWEDTIASWPGNERVHRQLAVEYTRVGDDAVALAHFNRAIELDPRSDQAYFGRGVLLLQHQEYQRALEDFDRGLQVNPAYAEGWNNRGIALASLGNPAAAVPSFSQALELKPGLLQAYQNRAIALSKLDRVVEAQSDAQRFVQMGGQPNEALRKILSHSP